MLLLTLAAGTAPAAPLWRRLPAPPGTVLNVLDGGLAVTDTGVVRFRDGAWALHASPPAADAGPYYRLDGDGVLWHFTLRPAAARRFSGGRWEPEEDIGLDVATAFVVGRGGAAWALTADGTVALRTGTGWQAPRPVDARYLVDGVADDAGGLWIATAAGPVVHLRADGTVQPAAGPLPRRATGDPAPCRVDHVATDAEGRPAVHCATGEVLVLAGDTGGTALAALAADLGDLGDRAAVAIDLDVDGLEDVLAWGLDGRVRALRQQAGTLVPMPVPRGVPDGVVAAAACDLDEDGRNDLVLWAGRHVVLRHRQGWFDPIAATAPAPARDVFSARCGDLDEDRDQDVIVPMGGDRHLGGRSVEWFENRGAGRVRHHAGERSLSSEAWITDVLLGDLDGDGLGDQLHLAPWRGVFARKGLGDGRGRPVRLGIGPWGTWPEKLRGWLDDVDGDGLLDALVADSLRGPRAWLSSPTLALRDATDALGLAELAPRGAVAAVYAELDGEPGRDLLGCDPRGCWTATRTPSGFVPGELPIDLGPRVRALVPIDLAGDGDSDLLVVRDGPDALLEHRGTGGERRAPRVDVVGAVASAASRRPAEHGILGGIQVGPWALAAFRAPGRRRGFVTATGVSAVALVAAIDLAPPLRWAIAAGSALAAAIAAGAAHARHRARALPRVDRYLLETRLGAGGLGTVWRALDPATGTRVALKVLRPDLFGGDVDRALFHREVELGSAVADPRLVRILRWGEVTVPMGTARRRTAWIAMELLAGTTLRERLTRTGPPGAGAAAAVGRELCLALEVLHEAGVVHGDVKPENVMLVGGGLKLMDFGAARARAGTGADGTVLATTGYAPPELRRGARPDPRHDVHAVGVVVRDLLGPELHEPLCEVVAHATAADPDHRIGSARELARRLAPFATALPEPIPRPRSSAAGWALGLRLAWRFVGYARSGRELTAAAFATHVLEHERSTPGSADPRTTAPAPGFLPTSPDREP